MRHPKDIGDRSLLALMVALERLNASIYVPFGENTRCDLIVDYGSRLSRIQCKTGRLKDGAVQFATCSTYAHHPNPKVVRRSYVGEIDEFGVYCPELGTVYIVPIEDVTARKEARLRVVPSRNNQSKGVRLAAPYEIARLEID